MFGVDCFCNRAWRFGRLVLRRKIHQSHWNKRLIFGYFGFGLARGFFEKALTWILISFVTLVLYGGLLFGVLPIHDEFPGRHIFVFLVGVDAARLKFSKEKTMLRSVTDHSVLAQLIEQPAKFRLAKIVRIDRFPHYSH